MPHTSTCLVQGGGWHECGATCFDPPGNHVLIRLLYYSRITPNAEGGSTKGVQSRPTGSHCLVYAVSLRFTNPEYDTKPMDGLTALLFFYHVAMLELDGRSLSFEAFRDACLVTNRPAIIRQAHHADFLNRDVLQAILHPHALRDTLGLNHKIPTYRVPHLGYSATPTAAHGKDDETVHYDEECRRVPLGEVFQSWAAAGQQPWVYYLKDWHFQSDWEAATSTSSSKAPYEVPPFLGDDWMDAFCRAAAADFSICRFGGGEDYRFAYIGPVHSWTGLHHDVFGTYSWSFNVYGEKLWFFPTPESNDRLMREAISGFPPPPDIRVLAGISYDTVVQLPGDLVFVPSLFFHQVHNISGLPVRLADAEGTVSVVSLCISVNHNWMNAWAIELMVRFFLRDVDTWGRLLNPSDLRIAFGEDTWRAEAERILMSGCNWDFKSVLSFLRFCTDLSTRDKKLHAQIKGLESDVRRAREEAFS